MFILIILNAIIGLSLPIYYLFSVHLSTALFCFILLILLCFWFSFLISFQKLEWFLVIKNSLLFLPFLLCPSVNATAFSQKSKKWKLRMQMSEYELQVHLAQKGFFCLFFKRRDFTSVSLRIGGNRTGFQGRRLVVH